MENTDANNVAALGLSDTPKSESDWLAIFLSLFSIASKSDSLSSRERELSERIAYLSGKIDVMEKAIFGGGT